MRWFSVSLGPFPSRLHFDSLEELDVECERLLSHALFRHFKRSFAPPLDDDTLQVLVGEVADIDLFATMASHEDGCTEFRPNRRPLVKINEALMLNPQRRKRARTTIAHEWFHAVYHRDAWESRWAHERAMGTPLTAVNPCRSILGAREEDWMDFQAGFASCAILVPRSWVLHDVEQLLSANACINQQELVRHVAERFDVSSEAAKWRLQHLGLLARLRDTRQCKLF